MESHLPASRAHGVTKLRRQRAIQWCPLPSVGAAEIAARILWSAIEKRLRVNSSAQCEAFHRSPKVMGVSCPISFVNAVLRIGGLATSLPRVRFCPSPCCKPWDRLQVSPQVDGLSTVPQRRPCNRFDGVIGKPKMLPPSRRRRFRR